MKNRKEFIKYQMYGSKRDHLPKQITTRARSLCPSPRGRRSNYNLKKISEQDPDLTTEARKRWENLEKPKGLWEFLTSVGWKDRTRRH